MGQSLFAVVMEAYLHGTITTNADDLVTALGAVGGSSKSEVLKTVARVVHVVASLPARTSKSMVAEMCY